MDEYFFHDFYSVIFSLRVVALHCRTNKKGTEDNVCLVYQEHLVVE